MAIATVTETLTEHPWLAEPCLGRMPTRQGNPSVYPEGSHPPKDCPACQGTGKRHCWAWERCPWEDHELCKDVRPEDLGVTEVCCDGSGWVLVVTLEKVIEAVERMGVFVSKLPVKDLYDWLMLTEEERHPPPPWTP